MGNILAASNGLAMVIGYVFLTFAAWLTLFIWLDIRKHRKQQDMTADEAKEYAQFKEWLTQFNRNVKYSSQEMIRLFQVWREYVPDAPIECRNSGELEEPA